MTPDKFADESLAAFEARIKKAQAALLRQIRSQVLKLSNENGKLLYNPQNLQQLAGIYQEGVKALTEAGYFGAVQELQASDKEMISLITAQSKVPMAFTATSKDVINSLRAIQTEKFANIGMQAIEGVKDVVTRAILGGQSIESTLDLITDNLDTKLQRYAWTYANTTRKDVIQAVHWEAAKESEGETYWEYYGPDDDITRPACRILLAEHGGYYTFDEMQAAEAQYADERAYNCRHYFIQIPKEVYDENVGGDKIDGSDINKKIQESQSISEIQDILKSEGIETSALPSINGKQGLENTKEAARAAIDVKKKVYDKLNIDGANQPNFVLNDPSIRSSIGRYNSADNSIRIADQGSDAINTMNSQAQARQAAGNQAWSVRSNNGAIYDATIHESGHFIHRKIITGTKGEEIIVQSYDKYKAAYKKEMDGLFSSSGFKSLNEASQREALYKLGKNLLSEYGLTSPSEYAAESFAAWFHGKTDIMDKAMIDLFNGLFGGK
jgi:hypothetical protein